VLREGGRRPDPRVSRRRRPPRALALLAVVAALAGLLAWLVAGLGHWLVTSDGLASARAIVVLGGHVPFRAMEAARLYQAGWAREVWLTRGVVLDEVVALERLGIEIVGEDAYNREVLERLGVPPGAIRVLHPRVRNTADEVRLIAGEARRVGGDRVILVTSKAHSRRVRATWRAVVGEVPRAVVRYAPEDRYNPDGWWRRTRDALTVSREVLGLANVWAGFPVQPEER